MAPGPPTRSAATPATHVRRGGRPSPAHRAVLPGGTVEIYPAGHSPEEPPLHSQGVSGDLMQVADATAGTLSVAAASARVLAPNSHGPARLQVRDGDSRTWPGHSDRRGRLGYGHADLHADRHGRSRLAVPSAGRTENCGNRDRDYQRQRNGSCDRKQRNGPPVLPFLRCLRPGRGACGVITPLMVDLRTSRRHGPQLARRRRGPSRTRSRPGSATTLGRARRFRLRNCTSAL